MSKKTFSSKEAFEYYEQEKSIAEAARSYCEAKGLEYTESQRKALSAYIKRHDLKDNDLENITVTETNQYSNDIESNEDMFMPSAWESDANKFLSIDEYCEKYGLPKDQVRSSKLVSHVSNHMVYNIAFNPVIHEQAGIDEEFITNIIKKYSTESFPSKSVNTTNLSSEYFDRLVITDAHLNMNPTGEINTDPLYSHTWNEKDVFERLNKTIDHVIKFKKSNTIVIDDLGDFMDGLQSQTTRGGHHLPQNTSDKEAFELGIKFKVYLADRLVKIYDQIMFNNVTNDNHSFLFGYFVNVAAKGIIENKYNNIEFNIQQKFMEHYSIGKHTFIICHGKDSGEQKFGMKAMFDTKVYEKIDQYCKNRNLYNGNYIELSKGDSHQRIFDTTSSNDFSYCSYGAFSPPSNWVGTNFKDTASSVDFFNIHREQNLKINIPLIF